VLATIEFGEQVIRRRYEIVVFWQIVRREGNPPREFDDELGSFPLRKGFNLLEQPFRGVRHRTQSSTVALFASSVATPAGVCVPAARMSGRTPLQTEIGAERSFPARRRYSTAKARNINSPRHSSWRTTASPDVNWSSVGAPLAYSGHGLTVDGEHDIARNEPAVARVDAVDNGRSHHHAGLHAPHRQHGRQASIQVHTENPEPRHDVLTRIGRARQIRERIVALGHCHGKLHDLTAAQHVEGDDIADQPAIQIDLQLATVLHRLAVERRDQVSRAQPGHRPRTAGNDIRQNHTVIARQTEASVRWAIERERARADQLAVVNNVKRVYFSILQTQSALTATNDAIARGLMQPASNGGPLVPVQLDSRLS
jgi:hypothetical protein